MPVYCSATIQSAILNKRVLNPTLVSGIVLLCPGCWKVPRRPQLPRPQLPRRDQVQDVFSMGSSRNHFPLDSSRIEISTLDNVPSDVVHSFLQVDHILEVVDRLVGSERGTVKCYIPTLNPDDCSATSITRTKTSCSLRIQKSVVLRFSKYYNMNPCVCTVR